MDAYVEAQVSLEGRNFARDDTTNLAQRYFHGQVADTTLAKWSEDAVTNLWGKGVKVEGFVSMLAIRVVREQVRSASINSQRHDAAVLGNPRAVGPATSVL